MATSRKDNIQSLTLKPSEVASCIIAARRTLRALFLWGQPGISKSAISKQVANELGIAFVDIRLSQMDPTDLRGLPYPTTIDGAEGVAWSAPLVLPRDIDIRNTKDIRAQETFISFYNPEGVNGIRYCTKPSVTVESLTEGATAELVSVKGNVFSVRLVNAEGKTVAGEVSYRVEGKVQAIIALEEFNSAPISVQAASYQLILDRRQGDYVVPDGVYLIAMGNRDTDKGVTFKMPTPIMNRFLHIEMKHDAKDWLDWALMTMQHPHVVGYIAAFEEQLNKFEASTAARGFQTPRTWEFVSDILKANEHDTSEMIMQALVIGAIGDAAGIQFMQHRKHAADLPKADDILSGRLKTLERTETQLAFALITTLCYDLKEGIDELRRHESDARKLKTTPEYAVWLERVDNFLLFLMDNFKPEIAIMGARTALSTHRLPLDTPKMKNFAAFSKRFMNLIVN